LYTGEPVTKYDFTQVLKSNSPPDAYKNMNKESMQRLRTELLDFAGPPIGQLLCVPSEPEILEYDRTLADRSLEDRTLEDDRTLQDRTLQEDRTLEDDRTLQDLTQADDRTLEDDRTLQDDRPQADDRTLAEAARHKPATSLFRECVDLLMAARGAAFFDSDAFRKMTRFYPDHPGKRIFERSRLLRRRLNMSPEDVDRYDAEWSAKFATYKPRAGCVRELTPLSMAMDACEQTIVLGGDPSQQLDAIKAHLDKVDDPRMRSRFKFISLDRAVIDDDLADVINSLYTGEPVTRIFPRGKVTVEMFTQALQNNRPPDAYAQQVLRTELLDFKGPPIGKLLCVPPAVYSGGGRTLAASVLLGVTTVMALLGSMSQA
jgi:hypothetical protein